MDQHLRMRWIADQAALERILASSTCDAALIEHTPGLSGLGCLEIVRRLAPRARRVVVVDACELKTLRTYLESGTATEIVYRPLDVASLLKACGVTPATARRPLSHA